MTKRIKTDLCVIGAGSGGLSVAAGAVQMGADVVLLEGGKMGGDCLNYGCIPSKALIAAGKHAHAMTTGAPFGRQRLLGGETHEEIKPASRWCGSCSNVVRCYRLRFQQRFS